MKKMILAMVVALAASGASAHAGGSAFSSEGCSNRREVSSSYRQIPGGTFALYRHPKKGEAGVREVIKGAQRYKNHVFYYSEHDGTPRRVSFFSCDGADEFLEKLRDGKSIDVSGCMVRTPLKKQKIAGGWCEETTYELYMDCDRLSIVSFADGLDFERYESGDPLAMPLQETETRCYGDRGTVNRR